MHTDVLARQSAFIRNEPSTSLVNSARSIWTSFAAIASALLTAMDESRSAQARRFLHDRCDLISDQPTGV